MKTQSPSFLCHLGVFICLVFVTPSHAEEVIHETGTWLQGVLRTPVTDSWRAYFEYQVRYMQQARQYERLLVRTALIYDISPDWAIYLGYGWTPTFQPAFNDENRYWQMATYKHSYENWVFQTWNRIEERTIQGIDQISYRLRSRQFLTQKTQTHEWGFSFWDEIFFHFSDSSSEIRRGFDQNRAFLGGQYRLTSKAIVEVGYMNLVVNRYAKDDRLQHTFLVAVIADI